MYIANDKYITNRLISSTFKLVFIFSSLLLSARIASLKNNDIISSFITGRFTNPYRFTFMRTLETGLGFSIYPHCSSPKFFYLILT